MAPVAAPVSVNVPPLHIVVADGVALTAVGAVLIVIAVVVTVVEPQGLVATNVYTPAEAVFTVKLAGVSAVEEKLLGPLHE